MLSFNLKHRLTTVLTFEYSEYVNNVLYLKLIYYISAVHVICFYGIASSTFFKLFHASSLFLYVLKISKIRDFLIFPGGIERDQWHEIH